RGTRLHEYGGGSWSATDPNARCSRDGSSRPYDRSDFGSQNMTWSILIDGWRPALEILILTVGIYYAFRFVRGTRGAPVVTGFLVVLLTFVLVSFLLQLTVLRYLLAAFAAYFVFSVLVLFQPELRRMLAELG